jgi:CRP-like cAMP-binding protein
MNSSPFLAASPLFRDLDEAEKAQILAIGQIRFYSPEETIFEEGTAGDGLFIVISGAVRISKRSASGEEALAILENNDFFGEMSLIDHSPRAANAISNGSCELFFVPLQELGDLIAANHSIALKVLHALCQVLVKRLRDTNDRYMGVFTIVQWGSGQQAGLIPLP